MIIIKKLLHKHKWKKWFEWNNNTKKFDIICYSCKCGSWKYGSMILNEQEYRARKRVV